MTDLRYLQNHTEQEQGGWIDVAVGSLAVAAVVALLCLFWMVLPGAKTVDDVLQIPSARIEVSK